MIFIFVTTRPAVQGNFAINVTVCRERSCVLESDALGVNVTLLSIVYSYLKNLQHCRACCLLLLC